MQPPDRSAFVAWCEQQFADVADMQALFVLLDRILSRWGTVRAEGNREADVAIYEAVKQAHARLGGTST